MNKITGKNVFQLIQVYFAKFKEMTEYLAKPRTNVKIQDNTIASKIYKTNSNTEYLDKAVIGMLNEFRYQNVTNCSCSQNHFLSAPEFNNSYLIISDPIPVEQTNRQIIQMLFFIQRCLNSSMDLETGISPKITDSHSSFIYM